MQFYDSFRHIAPAAHILIPDTHSHTHTHTDMCKGGGEEQIRVTANALSTFISFGANCLTTIHVCMQSGSTHAHTHTAMHSDMHSHIVALATSAL